MSIQRNVDLSCFNSFNISCSSSYYSEIYNVAGLENALDFARQRKLECIILGAGSNILFTCDYQGLVLHIKCLGIDIESADGSDKVLVKAAAGENWHQLVTYCLAGGIHGLENLALIPGTVGAAPIQNIGAYGVELEQFLHQVTVYDMQRQQVLTMNQDACEFAYRDSVFKREQRNQLVILDVTLCLSRSTETNTSYQALQQFLEQTMAVELAKVTPRQVFDAVCLIRRSKLPDPKQLGNAGSFFKNPIISRQRCQLLRSQFPNLPVYPTATTDEVKIPAGWLLEQAGWKGRKIGNVGVHQEQSLVLVNYGQGTGLELLELARAMQESVSALYGIDLEAEVRVI